MSQSQRDLFDAAPPAPLDATPPADARPARELEQAFSPSTDGERIALGCLLLRHGHLEPAHEHAQDVSGPYGDWLHAIMHRMEGDYGNSRYWCARAGGEQLYAAIAPGHTPKALTDRTEALAGDFTSTEAQAVQDQHNRELTVLFEYGCNA